MSYQDYLRSDAANLGVEKVLSSSPDVLLGVDGAAVHALSGLSGLGIATVFDLAGSSTFAAAAAVLGAGREAPGFGPRHRRHPSRLTRPGRQHHALRSRRPDRRLQQPAGPARPGRPVQHSDCSHERSRVP
ncbi:MAG: hypothetical protein ACHP7G_05255 [Actinomycetales bacterium]